MSGSFTLGDSAALGDLGTYLGRAGRLDDGSVRLISAGGVLAVYVAVLYPSGLLDESPTILGLRTFRVAEKEEFDVVVPLASFLMRIERARADSADAVSPVQIALPMQVNTVTWAAISPPRGGWTALDTVETAQLDRVARAGIDEVAAAVPASGTGDAIVHRVRAEVWGRPMRGSASLPAGAGFAALGLGFLPPTGEEETANVFETGVWTRVTTKRGHVLVKRRSWSLAR